METLEPYFQCATGVIIIGLAGWMLYQTRQAQKEIHQPKHDHEHDHHHQQDQLEGCEFGDAHERAHAAELKKQLTNQKITTTQIVLFGLTGGLLPCPSAFAVLLICLQLKKFTLGFALILGFSIGLAITLVTVGAIAALSVKHASKRFKGFGELARKLPYASSTILMVIGLSVFIQGIQHLLK